MANLVKNQYKIIDCVLLEETKYKPIMSLCDMFVFKYWAILEKIEPNDFNPNIFVYEFKDLGENGYLFSTEKKLKSGDILTDLYITWQP